MNFIDRHIVNEDCEHIERTISRSVRDSGKRSALYREWQLLTAFMNCSDESAEALSAVMGGGKVAPGFLFDFLGSWASLIPSERVVPCLKQAPPVLDEDTGLLTI